VTIWGQFYYTIYTKNVVHDVLALKVVHDVLALNSYQFVNILYSSNERISRNAIDF